MMIDILLSKVDKSQPKEVQTNQLREQLQFLILKIMSDHKRFMYVAFLGGTALRICHGVQRYSEDLDFSLIQKEGYDFLNLLKKLVNELKHYGFDVDTKYKQGIVDNCYIRFSNILPGLGLSEMDSQKLSIKIEIDTNPPSGYMIEKQIINNIFIYPIKAFDLPSLFAGKLHAILYRPFIKGRDRYDLIRYLTKKIEPNYILLQNAEYQTQKTRNIQNMKQICSSINDKLKNISTKQLLDDVESFLMNPGEKDILDIENIKYLLKKISL